MSLMKAHSQVDATIHAVLCHRFQTHGAEPALRRRCRWWIALDAAHGEGVAVCPEQTSTRPVSIESAPYFRRARLT
jgi:hypothetical protein